MEVDQELIHVAFEQIKARVQTLEYPVSIYKHLAFRMVRENCLGDSEWLEQALEETNKYVAHKRDLAERGGYSPFTFMGKSAYQWIRKNCAEWVLTAMETSFRDPEDIHPEWAVQCAKTMSVLGKDECSEQDDLYNYLMAHPEWEIQKEAREQYRKEWMRVKKQWERNHNPQQQRPQGRRQQQGGNSRRQYGQSQRPDRGPSMQHAGDAHEEAPKPIAHPHATPAKIEGILKFDTLPKGRPAADREFTLFEVAQDNLLITVEVRHSFYDRLCKMQQEQQAFAVVLSGVLEKSADDQYRMIHPFGHIYPKQNAANNEENSDSNPASEEPSSTQHLETAQQPS